MDFVVHHVAETERIARRVAANVVVEVRIYRYAGGDLLAQPFSPATEILVSITTAVSPRTVKSHVDKGTDPLLSRARAFHVVEAQRHTVAAHFGEHLVDILARVPEFQHGAAAAGQRCHECS